MLHMRLGEDPQWTLVRDRERLEFTDPPSSSPPPRWLDTGGVRTALGVLSALAITAILHADTAPLDAPATARVGLIARTDPPDTGGSASGRHAAVGTTRHGRRPTSQPAPATPGRRH